MDEKPSILSKIILEDSTKILVTKSTNLTHEFWRFFNLARGEIFLFPRAVIGQALTRSDSFNPQMNHPKKGRAPVFHNRKFMLNKKTILL